MGLPDIDYPGLTGDELAQLATDTNAEMLRRSLPAQMDALNRQYLDASGVEPGQEWVQPTGAHDAYPLDWLVTHAGTTWRSLVDANVWEPGVANWRQETGEEWPAWVQPTGSTDAYPAGAKVSHNGKHWTSDVDANVWEPGVFGWTEES